MPSFEEKLDKIASDLGSGVSVEPVMIRTFMEWAEIERRTRWNVDYIDRNLKKRNIVTIPDYKSVWVDNPIVFHLSESDNDFTQKTYKADEPSSGEYLGKTILEDPSFKIGDLKSAQTSPLLVSPNADLATAITLMMANDYSQLPVGDNYQEVKHVISWKSIAVRIVNGSKANLVKDLADHAYEVLSSAPIFGVVQTIAEHDYVLVRSKDQGHICGIVTGSDLSLRFEEISAPFLLISEIEVHIRNRIENMLPQSVAAPGIENESAKNNRKRTFYDYVEILKKRDNWDKIGLHVDQETFCNDLDSVRKIRNNVMHFSKEPPAEADIRKLRSVAKMLEFLRVV